MPDGSASFAPTTGASPRLVIDLSGELSAAFSRWAAAAVSWTTKDSSGHPRPSIRPRNSRLRWFHSHPHFHSSPAAAHCLASWDGAGSGS